MKLIIIILFAFFSSSCFSQSANDTIHLYKVKAYDPDGVPLHYQIIKCEDCIFNISHLTGWIYISKSDIKLLFIKNEHAFIVCVSDDIYTSCAIISVKTTNQTITINEGKFRGVQSNLE